MARNVKKPLLKVLVSPQERSTYLAQQLRLEGLSHIEENPLAAYCPISLTSTPENLKPFILKRQKVLMYEVLRPAGIIVYDPATAPYSPDLNLATQPNEIYAVDSGKIVGSRFFVGHNILPATGVGIEFEKAKHFNRIAVILMDKKIRISRMQPHRVIYLQYDNFEKQANQFVEVFTVLKEYTPGIGLFNQMPVLIGQHQTTGEIVNLEAKIAEEFPDLVYSYDGKASIVNLSSNDTHLFYEHSDNHHDTHHAK